MEVGSICKERQGKPETLILVYRRNRGKWMRATGYYLVSIRLDRYVFREHDKYRYRSSIRVPQNSLSFHPNANFQDLRAFD